MSSMEEDEGFEFEYSDEEDDVDGALIDVENAYYGAKGLLGADDAAALEGFEGVVVTGRDAADAGSGDWVFKALKQIVKLHLRAGRRGDFAQRYAEMLTCARDGTVTRNRAEKTVNSLLDHVAASQHATPELLADFFEQTLGVFTEDANERLWFKTSLKLAELKLASGDHAVLARRLRELHASCLAEDGTDDPKKGTRLLEVYALDIQLCTETRNTKRLRGLYARCLEVKSAIPHPRIMGIIRECGGKMHIGERAFHDAEKDFFEAFKSYDECGSPRRIQCLKYLVLANMLEQSTIDPFESQETKPYRDHPEIRAITGLVAAYQRNEVHEFERILRESHAVVMGDPFIREHIQDLLLNVRTQVLLGLLAPYTEVSLRHLADGLNVADTAEVEALLYTLILSGRIRGRIDKIEGTVSIDRARSGDATRVALAGLIAGVEAEHASTMTNFA
jgi:COP9 signalosome complex subunit 2